MKHLKKYNEQLSKSEKRDKIECEIIDMFPDFSPRIHIDSRFGLYSVTLNLYLESRGGRRAPFEAIDIIDELTELSKIGDNFVYSATYHPRNNVAFYRSVGELVRGKGGIELIVDLSIRFLYKDSTQCSNPECDNILEDGVEKCPVCGENK